MTKEDTELSKGDLPNLPLLHLLHCMWILNPLSLQGSPCWTYAKAWHAVLLPSLVASPLLSSVSSFVITYCLVLTAHAHQYFHEKSRKGDIVSNLYTWKCFILLPYLIDNLAAFIIAVSKPSTLRILKKLLYHLLDMWGVAEKSNVFILFDAFFCYADLFLLFQRSLNFLSSLSKFACLCILGNLSFIIFWLKLF